ncbi:hypothetical protein NQ318_023549 [Aromia moschata]|uniref:HAT C-terminal dimerisation domain-containing protein n=1 Tax=Aromia moschata TaxID=1265417 RepID=A0AAV8YPN6_9CUCU|nr:hypothetical protein NQ318_023549 [Aromia moschata]
MVYSLCVQHKKKKFENAVMRGVTKVTEGLNVRLGHVENSHTLAISSFLDPRFKMMSFENSGVAENIKKTIISLVAAKIASKQKQSTPIENVDEKQIDDETDELSIWGKLNNNISTKSQPQDNATSRAIIEVQRYLEFEVLPRHDDPLKFWREQRFNFPNLTAVVQERFCVLAPSVPCERLFSKAGLVITDRRNKLSV